MCFKKMQQVNLIDLKIIFSEDAKEWDKYLTDCLTEAIESASYQLQIVHERIENIQLNLPNDFSFGQQAIANLIIISPDFLNYVQNNFKLKLYFNNFKKENTICMLCGVKKSELTNQIKHNLVHFDSWKCLIAKDQDNNFIYNVIDSIRNILQKNSHHQDNEIYSAYSFINTIRCKKPMPVPNYANEYKNLDTLNLNNEVIKKSKNTKISKFKISPRKVKTGSNKVFILLDEPLEDKYKPKVTLEFKTPSKLNQKFKQELEEVQVLKKNPYTLQFIVPGNLLNSSKVISVNLYTELGNETKQFGNRLLKCEYEKNDFLEVIQKFSDCISFLKQSLRLDTLEELDLELSKRFKSSLPIDEFNKFFNEKQTNDKLIETNLIDDGTINISNNDWSIKEKMNLTKFPTLLHFAAKYNLKELASSLLKCKFFLNATLIKNCDGLTPLGIADLNKNEDISNIIKNSLYKNSNLSNKNDELNYVNMASLNINKLDLLNDFNSSNSDHSSNENINKFTFKIDCTEQNIKNKKEEEEGNLIDLNDTSNDEDYLNSSDDENKFNNENNYSNNSSPLKYEVKSDNNDYDIVKTSPRRANILNTKTVILDRFDELRLSTDSYEEKKVKKNQEDDNLILSSNLQTSNLTESQIELMNIINAFKMGVYTNDEMEKKFKLWAVKYKYKIDIEKKKDESSSIKLGKRSVSSSHLLSQDLNSDLKENDNNKKSTIKTCLSNLNLNNVSPTKLNNKQFSITEWFHFLTSKLKQKNETLLQHKSPKFEKKEKTTSPSKISSVWSKKLSTSNVLAVRKSLLTPKEFEKLKSSPETNDKLIDVKDSKVKSLTLPLRAVNTNKSISPVKIKKKLNLNIKKNSKSNLNNIETSTIEKPKLIENLNNNFNIIDKNKLNIMPVLSNEWNSFKLDENNKIILSSLESTKNNLNINEYNEYDRIPLGPPIPAKPLSCNQY